VIILANIKRKCPGCAEKDTTYHNDVLGGDRIILQGGKLYCICCGYDGSQQTWIVDTQ
jgi:hypothetical protein